MPGHVKQVPQDSTEWDRTDTGHSTDKHLHMWSRTKLLFWTPLVISYKKYIYTGSYLCVFIRVWLTSSIMVTPDFEHKVKRYPVSWFSWTLNIKWYIRASWPTEKKLQPSLLPKSPSSSLISEQRIPTCGSFMQRWPSETPRSHSQKPNWTTSYRNFPRRLWSRYLAWSWVLLPPQKPLIRI